jgi:hypothetical protein
MQLRQVLTITASKELSSVSEHIKLTLAPQTLNICETAHCHV